MLTLVPNMVSFTQPTPEGNNHECRLPKFISKIFQTCNGDQKHPLLEIYGTE